MDRTTLTRILEACEGVTGKDDTYEAGEHQRLTFYLGRPGDAMVVSDVVSCVNGAHFVKLVVRDDGTALYVEHDSVAAVSVRPPKGTGRRPGFA